MRSPAILVGDHGYTLTRGTGIVVADTFFGKRRVPLEIGVPKDFRRPASASVTDVDGAILEFDLSQQQAPPIIPFFAQVLSLFGFVWTTSYAAALLFGAFVSTTTAVVAWSKAPPMSMSALELAVKREVSAGTSGFGTSLIDDTPKEVLDKSGDIIREIRN